MTRLIRRASELDLDFTAPPKARVTITQAPSRAVASPVTTKGTEESVSSDDDDDSFIVYTSSESDHNDTDDAESIEERRLLDLLGVSSLPLRTQILNSHMTDLNKGKCLQLLQQYNADPDNNYTSLNALELILRLPTSQRDTFAAETQHESLVNILNGAQDAMDKAVYGQQAAKIEIIEYLMSKLLLSSATTAPVKPMGRVLGLVGPPGVGKTSLAINGIAKALNLPFSSISVGGLRDVTFFNGSFPCWKGSHHGKLTDILVQEGCLNPVIYIDELDKVSAEAATDIYGALTHITDPLTNSKIHDYFLGMDVDLSAVTFIFSYNDPSILPAPLRERIKEVYFTGFSEEERVVIARDYIIPACLTDYGMSDTFIFSDEVIRYANKRIDGKHPVVEGVRILKKSYQTIIGKLALQIVTNRDLYEKFTGKKQRAHSVVQRFHPYHRQHKVAKTLPHKVTQGEISLYI